jgi:hypothetical protein
MNKTLIMSALIGAAALASTPVFAAASKTTAKCQPLSSANIEACCGAAGWRDIILPGEYRYCPPLNSSDNDSGRIGDDIAGNEVLDNPDTTGSIGNPGNIKDVGAAGEKGKDNENPSTGTRGDSN